MSTITACRNCGSNRLRRFLDLGRQPLANALLPAEALDRPERTYELAVVFCKDCTEIQITETVPPEILFSDYIYFSSFSKTMLDHAREVATWLTRERRLGPRSLVVEIASNDGYLLKNFVENGIPVLGVEPAKNIAAFANEHGIRTLNEFFGEAVGKRLARERRADVMLANNVMAHVPDINDVVAGISSLLADDGIFVMETPYAKDMITGLEFDTMYHEHVFCHSLTALEQLFRRHGLAASDVDWIPIHGGTIQVSATHAGHEGARPRVAAMLADEEKWAADPTFYADFGRRVDALKRDLVELLERLRSGGKRIAGYGAAAKGVTLMNYMGIGATHLDYVADISTHKQGRHLPGSHVPVRSPDHLLKDEPDYVLLLAWNLADEIMKQLDGYRAGGGRFIVPVPSVRIV